MEAFAPRAAAAVSLAAAGVAAALWQVMRPTAEQKHMERQQVLIDAAIRELQNWSSGSEWRLRHQHHAVPGDEAPSTPVRGNRGGSAGSQLVALTAEDEEEAVDLIARAFTGSDASERPELGLDWVMGPAVRGQWEGLRYDAVRHNLRWCFLFTVGGAGVALGVRLPDGTLGAVCLAHPYIGDNGGRGGPPAVYPDIGPGPIDRGELGDWARKRAEWFYGGKGNLLDRLHGECAPGPHWYVQIMAVDPAQQGKGLCGRALRAISFLADKAGVPCFLDTCGEQNRATYSRLGYETSRGYELNVPGDPAPIRDPALPKPAQAMATTAKGQHAAVCVDIIRHFGMVRLPKSEGGTKGEAPTGWGSPSRS